MRDQTRFKQTIYFGKKQSFWSLTLKLVIN